LLEEQHLTAASGFPEEQHLTAAGITPGRHAEKSNQDRNFMA